jgi:hypothetical protein
VGGTIYAASPQFPYFIKTYQALRHEAWGGVVLTAR